MKSMGIGLALKPPSSSSSRPPILVPTALASGHGEVEVSRVHLSKTFRSEHSKIKFARLRSLRSHKLNHLENGDKYLTEFHPHQIRKTKFLANAASEFSQNAHDSGGVRSQINGNSLVATLNVLYRYSKVYTLIGTTFSIVSISLLAVKKLSDFTPLFFLGVLQAIIGGCVATLYIGSINQLSDIEIDKINKPYLPLASGELSVRNGILLTSFYAILGFCLGCGVNSWPLKLGLFLSFVFGTVYSVNVPLLRWKRHPVLAAICVWSVQGAIIPMLFYLHAQTHVYGRPLVLSKHAIFVSGFMSIFAIVFALFKDIPDVEGDKINGINSLASQVGQKKVFWICIWLLEMAYGMATLVGLSSTRFWIRSIMVIGHSILGFIVWTKANLVDLKNNEAIESFYLFIWKLYSLEYLLVPILRF